MTVLLLVSLVFAGCGGSSSNDKLSVMLDSNIVSLDSAQCTDSTSFEVIADCIDGLFQLDENGKAKSSFTKNLAGKTFKLSDNQFGWRDISFSQGNKQLTITITDAQGIRSELSAGYRQWLTTWTPARPPYSMNAQQKFKGIEGDFAVAASYAWNSSNTLHLNLQYVNWISALDLTLTFQGDKVSITVHKNYEPDVPQFTGTI